MKWTIGPEVDGQVDVLCFSELEDDYLEALAAFKDTHIGETWYLVEQFAFGEHSQGATFERAVEQ